MTRAMGTVCAVVAASAGCASSHVHDGAASIVGSWISAGRDDTGMPYEHTLVFDGTDESGALTAASTYVPLDASVGDGCTAVTQQRGTYTFDGTTLASTWESWSRTASGCARASDDGTVSRPFEPPMTGEADIVVTETTLTAADVEGETYERVE